MPQPWYVTAFAVLRPASHDLKWLLDGSATKVILSGSRKTQMSLMALFLDSLQSSMLSHTGRWSSSEAGVQGEWELSFPNIPALSMIYAYNDEGGTELCKPAVTCVTSLKLQLHLFSLLGESVVFIYLWFIKFHPWKTAGFGEQAHSRNQPVKSHKDQ